MAEIVYVIDSKDPDMLVIQLIEAKKLGTQFNFEPAKPLLASHIRALASENEREAIQALINEELQFQRQKTGRTPHADSTSFHVIHVGINQAIPILKLLAATQKLFFKGKQLVADFYGKVEFYYKIQMLDKERIDVSGRLKWRDQDISIRECDWIGPGKPCWFIRGLSLKVIWTAIGWKALKQASHTHPWILNGVEKTRFLEDLDPEDPETPQAEFIGGSASQINQLPEPLPMLMLKDRSGAFADLWMDYGNGHCFSIKDMKGLRRNIEAEKSWERDLLETDFVRKDMGNSHYYCPLDKVAKSLSFLLEIGWHIQDWKGNRVLKQGSLQLHVDQASQVFVVKGKMHYEDYEANLADVVGAFNRRERFIQLGQGVSGLLETQSSLEELAEEGEVIGQAIQIKKSHLGNLNSLFNEAACVPTLSGLKERLQHFRHIEEASSGPGFNGQLRPYQQEGLNWLAFLVQYGFHGMLADDMGLGKTIQVLALLSRLPQDRPHLIVVPTSLLFNWRNEIGKFLPTRAPYLHHGPHRAKTAAELEKQAFILTSYATLRSDLPLLQKLSYYSLILDEAQVIKNAHTQTAQAVCQLDAQFRLSITGTPIENHLSEIWSHFHFLIPDLLEDEDHFEAELKAAESDTRYIQRIKKKINPFILRRTKEQVAQDLPERIDQTIWVEMGNDQRRFYEEFLSKIKGNLLKKVEIDGLAKHRIEIFEAILRLRQICCHPLLVSSLQEEEDTVVDSAKFEFLMNDLETVLEEKRKVIIYSQFTSMLQLMVKKARESQWKYAYLDGSTANREKVVSTFQEDPSTQLFFISLKAGGVGLNLTAADYVFLYDPWWNNAVEEQAINRAHRIGRKETVIAKRYVTLESIEERMMKLKEAKQNLVGELLEGSLEGSTLTMDDLYYLLE